MRAFFVFLVVQTVLLGISPSGRLQVVVVENIEDHDIGGCLDGERMKTSLQVIGKKIGFPVDLVDLRKKTFIVPEVMSALKNLPKSSKNIIVFYYTGHGFNDKRVSCRWPTLCVHPKRQDAHIAGNAVISYLKQQKKRFALIIFDCCNSFSVSGRIIHCIRSPLDAARALACKDNLTGLAGLFLKTRGLVILAAAPPGKDSEGDRCRGGWLTDSFLRTLKRKGADRNLRWEDILRDTSNLTKLLAQSLGSSQRPIYDIRKE